MKTSEFASAHLESLEEHTLEELHPSHTVEDHCPQLYLSIDEKLDDVRMVRSDAKMRWCDWWQDEVGS